MSRLLAAVTAAAFALSLTGAADAAAPAPQKCRNTQGKFIKCPTAPAPKQVCKDAKGKFVKCGAPGATPLKK